MIYINEKLKIPLNEIEFIFIKGSGPGGQKINKTNSKAQLFWNIYNSKSLTKETLQLVEKKLKRSITENGDITISSQKHRDREKNKRDCIEKFKRKLQKVFLRPKKRIPTKPSKESIEKRLTEKKKLKEKKNLRQKLK